MLLFVLPRSEHVKRFPDCGFLTMKKDFTELTVAELYNMEKERLKIFYVRTGCTEPWIVSSHLRLFFYLFLIT